MRHSMTLRPIVLLAALGLGLGATLANGTRAAGQTASPSAAVEPLVRVNHDVPGDSKPLVLHADQVVTWTEGTRRGILLQGQVFVQQGLVQARFAQGVVWIDLDKHRKTKVCHADVYAEGNVQVENGTESNRGGRALLSFTTRGELGMTAQKGKIQQLSGTPNEPLIQRGLTELTALTSPVPAALPQLQPVTPLVPPGPPVMPQAAPLTPPADSLGKRPEPVKQSTPPPAAPQLPPPSAVVPAAFGGVKKDAPAVSLPGGGLTPSVPVQQVPDLPPLQAPPSGPPAPRPGQAPPADQDAPPKTTKPKLPGGPAVQPQRFFSIAPRTLQRFQSQRINLPSGEQAWVITGGVTLQIRGTEEVGLVDIEADRLVLWARAGKGGGNLLDDLKQPGGSDAPEMEVYMSGNVEIRQEGGPFDMALPVPKPKPGTSTTAPGLPPPSEAGKTVTASRTLRADEVYYNVSKNTAIAVNGDLEFMQPGLPDPMHFTGVELQQLSPNQFRAIKAEIFSSKLPSDPGLKIRMEQAVLEEKKVPRNSWLFGPIIDPETGKQKIDPVSLVTATNTVVEVENVPVYFLPWSQFDARDPLGPLEAMTIGYNRIFGLQLGATLDIFDLVGLDRPQGTRWNLNLDYLSDRGPGLGSEFENESLTWFGLPAESVLGIRTWGLYDDGEDILGGGRGENDDHPNWRGWFQLRHLVNDLPAGFQVQTQVSAQSDHNFLEQFYKQTWDLDPNQETFLYVKQQNDNWAWSILGEQRIRPWVTETSWLPRADAWLVGATWLDRLTYSSHASAGYAELKPTQQGPPPISSTDQFASTGRFDLWQELSLPVHLGPVTFQPYGVLDLTYYNEDLNGEGAERVYGGGGVRASLPFSKLYPGIQSSWFNVDGIFHKFVLSANYYIAGTNVSYLDLPQLDRLNDDATDQAIRDFRPVTGNYNMAFATDIATNPALYDPQVYAIRRLVDNRTDTLDDIQVLQFGVRNRWQTKRGYPGQEHIVDWATFELSGSFFPAPDRDNFGEPFAFLEYDWLWNVGDRNGFFSHGWLDPIDGGARVFTFGAFFDRPDRTSWFLGYRFIDPVGSQAVTAAFTYIFSPKYAVTASAVYDFGTRQSLSNTLMLTRMGKDIQLGFGITYNAMQNNFGVIFEVLPNLVAMNRTGGRSGAMLGGPGGGLLGSGR